MRLSLLGLLTLLLTAACGGPLQQIPQPISPNPSAFLSDLRAGRFENAQAFLSDGVNFIDANGARQGKANITAELVSFPINSAALIDKHHHIARMNLADKSLLVVKSNDDDAITEVIRFSPPGQAMVPPTDALRAYQMAWNLDGQQRASLLNTGWSNRSRYLDPTADGTGPAELSAIIDAFRKQFAGAEIVAEEDMQQLPQGWATFGWRLQLGTSELLGFDVVQLDEEGRPLLVAGFFSSRDNG